MRSVRPRSLLPGHETYWKGLIERYYDLEVRAVELAWTGANVTLRIDTGADSFFLRLYRENGRSRAEIDAEIGALLTFRPAKRVYVSTPVQRSSGEYVFACRYDERPRWAALFRTAPGSIPLGSTADLRRLGEALGVLHQQMARAFPAGRPFDVRGTISRAVDNAAALGPAFRSAHMKIMEAVSVAELEKAAPLRLGFCHGDVWSGKNVHFRGEQVTFFDFDECVDGPLAIDLATPIAGLWYAGQSDFPSRCRAFLDAYIAVQSLESDDILIVPALVRLFEVKLLGFLAGSGTVEPHEWEMALDHFDRRVEEWGHGGPAAATVFEYARISTA